MPIQKAEHVDTHAVILSGPRSLHLGQVGLNAPALGDVVVKVRHSGISTGTEKLFWQGTMPPFPGMGYPLVPGYEAFGEVVETCGETGLSVGTPGGGIVELRPAGRPWCSTVRSWRCSRSPSTTAASSRPTTGWTRRR